MAQGYLTTYLENGKPLSFQTWYYGTSGQQANRTYILVNAFSLICWQLITNDIEVGTIAKHTLPNGYYFKSEVKGKTENNVMVSTAFYDSNDTLIASGGSLYMPYNQYYYALVKIREWDKRGAIYAFFTEDTKYAPTSEVSDNNPQFVDWTAYDNGSVYPKSSSYFFTPNIDFNNLPDMEWTKPDPYNPGGNASPEGSGGGGDFDISSDPIPFPTLPTLNATTTGFLSIYAPLIGEVNALADYMWTDDFITNVKKLYSDPADALISFGIVPFSIPSVIDSDVKVGGVSTNLSMHRAVSQYVEIDCGTLSLHEFFGSCFDYQPYTSLQLYCPFSGYHTIDVDNCMSNTLALKYQFDILSGSFVAFLKVGDAVMYQWGGTALMSLPISSYSMDALIKGAVTATASVAGAVATGGALAPIAGAMTVASVTSMKPEISHGGGVGSASALFSVRQPYVIIKRPRQVLPKSQNVYMGYPAVYTAALDTLSGYTEIESIHLENMTCTDNETSEIEELLQRGVIL